jgi:hypothetical protein
MMMLIGSFLRSSKLATKRSFSSYVLDGLGASGRAALGGRGSSLWHWPVTKPNTIFNIVPQGVCVVA